MDTRNSRFTLRAALLAGAACLAGCASMGTTTPRWDLSFGDTVRSTFAAQVINPAAVRNTDPVAGVDGRSARAAHEQYERSIIQPQPAPASLMTGTR